MTKLCNTCEYLRYCARSGIEDVGCDRYQKDNTTNEEWLKHCNTEQLAKWIQYVICHCKHCNADNAFLCQFYDKVGFVPCVGDGLVEWLKQPHTFE